MSVTPAPGRLLTIADYTALPEDEVQRCELVEGTLVMTPSATPRHMIVIGSLFAELRAQLPAGLRVVPDVDLDLQLAPLARPGTVRRPDVVVVTADELARVDAEGGLLRADAAVLVVEVLSPGSHRTDQVHKRNDYADAGIDHYWIVDPEPPVSIVACRQAGAAGYLDDRTVSGGFDTVDPFPVRIDLDALI